jgi:hypothetical protein
VYGCATCDVTWFGTDEQCWVCGGTGEGPVVIVAATGAQTWSSSGCEAGADDEETAAFLGGVTAP